MLPICVVLNVTNDRRLLGVDLTTSHQYSRRTAQPMPISNAYHGISGDYPTTNNNVPVNRTRQNDVAQRARLSFRCDVIDQPVQRAVEHRRGMLPGVDAGWTIPYERHLLLTIGVPSVILRIRSD